MKYKFLQEKFDEQSEEIEHEDVIAEFRSSKTFKFTSVAISYMLIYDLFQIILIYFTIPGDTYLWGCVAGFFCEVILGSIVLFAKKSDVVKNKIKILSFLIFYACQAYFTIHVTTYYKDSFRIIRNLYILYIMTNFFTIILLELQHWMTILVVVCNFLITFFVQFYVSFGGNKLVYAKEFIMLAEISIACFITRNEYEKLNRITYAHMSKNKKGMEYIDTLLDQQPNSFLSISNNQVVYSNTTCQNLLKKVCFYEQEEIKNNINIEVTVLQEKLNNEKAEIDSNTLASGFLKNSTFNFIDENIKDYLTEVVGSKFNEKNCLDLLQGINDSKIAHEFIKDGNFHFIGITEYYSDKINDSIFNNCYFRKVVYNKTNWIELMLSDITISKKVQNLNEIVKMKEGLLSKIAHEFKTPLICICTLADQLNAKKASTKEEINAKVSQIGDLSNYTLYLINDIISYLKTKKSLENCKENNNKEAIEVQINKNKTNLDEIMNSCFRVLKTLLVYHQDKSQYIKPLLKNRRNVTFNSDEQRIKQIILNLISNAVKFTKTGKISLISEIKENEIIITVEDTGLGIKDEDKHKIFGDGNMLEAHKCLNKMGSGLGLSISHYIAGLLGGSLNFISHVGFGSKFYLSIPLTSHEDSFTSFVSETGKLVKDDSYTNEIIKGIKQEIISVSENNNENLTINNHEDSIANASMNSENNSIETIKANLKLNLTPKAKKQDLIRKSSNISSKSLFKTDDTFLNPQSHEQILIIDDNNIILESIENVFKTVVKNLKISNLSVRKANDGIDLIKIITEDQKQGNKIKCVLIDENMEFMNGSEAINILRKYEKEQKIKKVHICSISATEDDNRDLIDEVMSKPVTVKNLESLIKRLNLGGNFV